MKHAQYSVDDWFRSGSPDGFRHRGHPIFYRDDGQGPALLLIHGFPTSSFDWLYVWPELRQRYRLIAADMLGFGFSAKPANYPYSIADQADLHEALLAQLGVREAHILAHDYGDTVAQELLARYEERLRLKGSEPGATDDAHLSGPNYKSICFLNGGLFPETHRPRLIQKLLIGPLGPIITRLIRERSFRKSFSAVFGSRSQPTERELTDFWRLIQYNDGIKNYHKLIGFMRERRINRERWVAPLQTTRVPLRLINGPADPISGLHMTERYRELVPNPDIVLLYAIGHYPQTEDPVGVVRAVLEFATRYD